MRKLHTKLMNLIKRAYVTRSLEDTGYYPMTHISYFGTAGTSEVLNPYGLSSRLPKDIQVLLWSVQGHENNRICMGYSQDGRFKNLEEGEVQLGNPVALSSIKFDKDGNIDITSPGKVTVTSQDDVTVNTQGKAIINAVGDVDVTTTGGNVNVDAAQTNLGSGGNQIARVGDTIKVNVGGTDYFGTIETGGTNTSI